MVLLFIIMGLLIGNIIAVNYYLRKSRKLLKECEDKIRALVASYGQIVS